MACVDSSVLMKARPAEIAGSACKCTNESGTIRQRARSIDAEGSSGRAHAISPGLGAGLPAPGPRRSMLPRCVSLPASGFF